MYIQLNIGRRYILLRERIFPLVILPILFCLVTGFFSKFAIQVTLWKLVYGLSFLWWGLTLRRTLDVIWHWRVLFVLPAIAILSTIWTTHTALTLTGSIQFAFSTLLAVRIASVLKSQTIILIFLIATGAGVVASTATLVTPLFQPNFESNGAFTGIYVQKTVAGVAFSLFTVALAAYSGVTHRYTIISTLLIAATIPLIIAAKSVSALIVFAFAPFVLVSRLFVQGSGTFRLGLFLSGTIFTSLTVGVLWLDDFDLSAAALRAVGKEPSLTGRTNIWDIGIEMWLTQPITGVGYNAFWLNPEFAEVVGYLHGTVDPRLKGFHNLMIEALVTTGLIGLFAVVVTYLWSFLKCLYWYISGGSIEALFWTVIMSVALILSISDNAFFKGHEKFHMLAMMAFVVALPRSYRTRPQPPDQQHFMTAADQSDH